jgi:hypothetical protein
MCEGRRYALPVECAGQDKIVICVQLINAALKECLVVYQAPCLVDDDEREHSPRLLLAQA